MICLQVISFYYGESSLVLLPPKPSFLNTLSTLMALMPQNIYKRLLRKAMLLSKLLLIHLIISMLLWKRIFWKVRELQDYLRWRLQIWTKPFMTTFRRRISNRGYKLTPKGEQILEQYKGIINRHPKKNLYASDFLVDFLLNYLVTNIWNPLPFRVQW